MVKVMIYSKPSKEVALMAHYRIYMNYRNEIGSDIQVIWDVCVKGKNVKKKLISCSNHYENVSGIGLNTCYNIKIVKVNPGEWDGERFITCASDQLIAERDSEKLWS
jgi:hypothetical protein